MLVTLGEMLASPLMQRALFAAVLVGLSAPVVGTFLVQRKLALMGDGIGHVALTGVASGWLVGSWAGAVPPESFAIPGAVAAAIIGAVAIEFMQSRGKASSDTALALLFYGGIAGGVLLMRLAGGTSATLMNYLFGSITTVSTADLVWIGLLAAVIIATCTGLFTALLAVTQDPQHAAGSGLPVRLLSLIIAVLTALTVTVAMRVVGLLLVSALMIVPVTAAQLWTRSMRATAFTSAVLGGVVSVVGLSITYFVDLPPGATIVVLAIALYLVSLTVHQVAQKVRLRKRVTQGRVPQAS